MRQTARRVYPLRQWRELYGIARGRLADEADIHPTTLDRIERGEMEPTVGTAISIVEALDRLAKPMLPAAMRDETWITLTEVFHDPDGNYLWDAEDRLSKHADAGYGITAPAPAAPPPTDHKRLDAEPFRDWLRWLKDAEGLSSAALAHHVGMSSGSEVRAILAGNRKTVRRSVVDAALARGGHRALSELYPDA
jgi:DNA-binding XRE family transcriptional regulator